MSSSTAAPSGEITAPKAMSYENTESALTSVLSQLLDFATKSYKVALEEKEARIKKEADESSKSSALKQKLEEMRMKRDSDGSQDDEEAKLREEEEILDKENTSIASGKAPEVGTVASDVKKNGKSEDFEARRQARLNAIRARIKAKRIAQARMLSQLRASEENDVAKKEEARKKLEELKTKIAEVKKRVEEAKAKREAAGTTQKMEAAASGKAQVGAVKEESSLQSSLTGVQEQPIPNYWNEILKASKKFRENGQLS